MDTEQIVIVGGGLAGARVVESYREAGGEAPIVLISADRRPPYHRPPLSKRLLRGESEPEQALVAPAEAYAEKGAELRLETEATGVDLARREVELAGGERLPYGRLVIATGALPRRLPVPGSDLEGVHTLRTLDDSLAIREHARAARRAVAIGTGFIGLETTASLRALGVEVTIVDVATAPFPTLAAPAFSDFLVELYRSNGVEMLLGDGVAEFSGDGSLRAVRTTSGRELDADLTIVGVGVAPSVGWLEGVGIELANGVVVDERFRTSADGVFAVGDVANFRDPVLGVQHRIEHWSNADYQGKQLGKLLAGRDEPYDKVASFFTELFGTTYKVFGTSAGHDRQVLDGSFHEGTAALYYLQDGRIRAVLHTGQAEEREAELLELVRSGAPLA